MQSNSTLTPEQENCCELLNRLDAARYDADDKHQALKKLSAFLESLVQHGQKIDFSVEAQHVQLLKLDGDKDDPYTLFSRMFGSSCSARDFRLVVSAGFRPTEDDIDALFVGIIEVPDQEIEGFFTLLLDLGMNVARHDYFPVWFRLLIFNPNDRENGALDEKTECMIDRLLECVYPVCFEHQHQSRVRYDWRDLSGPIQSTIDSSDWLRRLGNQIDPSLYLDVIEYAKSKRVYYDVEFEVDRAQTAQIDRHYRILVKLTEARVRAEIWLRDCRRAMMAYLVDDISAPVLRIASEYM